MAAFFWMIGMAPLFFGLWFSFFPESVPGWVVLLPVTLLSLVWIFETELMIHRSYLRGPMDFGFDTSKQQNQQTTPTSPPSDVNPVVIRVLGWISLALWFVIAFIYKIVVLDAPRVVLQS